MILDIDGHSILNHPKVVGRDPQKNHNGPYLPPLLRCKTVEASRVGR